ncbi:hypothetical protein [Mycolicibacterium insubricum]|uniref:hypothetical protein n=1 Tax=Mycolicibacterium insubricum TaxID=444597 RepID=UPI0021F2EEB1|nr:hypothetical protein [Mycolicibacterium insubricum]MCV7081573.1 hypothetical protein [Mycolicibacterium insubricum]
MIIYTDTVNTWGNSATVHYTHPACDVLAQTTLAMHLQFNSNLPPSPMFRSYAFIRSVVVDGAAITVNAPTLTAAGLTELTVELFTENGASAGVVNEFDTTGAHVGPPVAAATARRVSFHRRVNGTTPTRTPSGCTRAAGTSVSRKRSRRVGILPSLGLDPAGLIMKVTTDPASVSRPQRLDLATDELLDESADGFFE